MTDLIKIIKEKLDNTKQNIKYYSNLRCFVNITQSFISIFNVVITSTSLSNIIPINSFQYIILTSTILNTLISVIQVKYPYTKRLRKLKNIQLKIENLLIKYSTLELSEIIKAYEKINIELYKVSNDSTPPNSPLPKEEEV